MGDVTAARMVGLQKRVLLLVRVCREDESAMSRCVTCMHKAHVGPCDWDKVGLQGEHLVCSCSGTTEERPDGNKSYREIMSKLFGNEMQQGIERERKAVVAWLRAAGMADTADKIECGEHVKEEP